MLNLTKFRATRCMHVGIAFRSHLHKSTPTMPVKNKRQAQVEDQKRSDKRSKPPEYGQQEYWNARYRDVLLESTKNSRDRDDADSQLPYHDWYFTYDELRPILMPLLFGPQSHMFLSNDENEQDNEVDSDVSDNSIVNQTADVADGQHETSLLADSDHSIDLSDKEEVEGGDNYDDDDDDEEYEEFCDDNDDEPVARPGLVGKAGPITILEVGCGDRPLGSALAVELWSRMTDAETTVTISAAAIKKIICSDYSPIVIDVMKKEYFTAKANDDLPTTAVNVNDDHKTSHCSFGEIPLQFEVLDATALPYSANSIELVLEKGTLDAVISDKTHGRKNAIRIMSECARVVLVGGYIVLISHLNAHFPAGLSWLETVVFAGLKQGDGSCDWMIEVHGKSELSRADDESVDSIPAGATGSAVYIIHKLAPAEVAQRSGTVPVRFFGY
jgi:hypothetical protein